MEPLSLEFKEAFVAITHEEYGLLKQDSEILTALRDGGVDNWEWYDAALEGLA